VRSGATLSLGAGTSAGLGAVDAGGAIVGSGIVYTGDDEIGAVAGELSGVTVGTDGGYPIELKSGGRAIDVSVGDVVDDFNQLGELSVDSGATTTGAAILGEEIVQAGGAAIGTTVSVGVINVLGTTTGTIVFASSFIKSGGVASGTITESNGKEAVYYGGVASGAIVSAGGREVVRLGGVASQTTVLSGGVEYLWAGTTTGTQVSAGGKEVVSSGGLANAATVLSGGQEYVVSGGVGSGAIVSGGEEIVRSGGLAEATTLLSRAVEYVSSGGADAGAVVSAGGKQVISSGGVATGLTLLSGGELVDDGEVRIAGDATLAGILSGSGAVIETGGGTLLLSSYGDRDFAGKAAISGGTIELATVGALGSGYAQFVEPSTGSAVLQVDAADAPKAGGTFVNTIDDFSGANEAIDMRSIAFVAGAFATLTGSTLVLHDGGKTYTFDVAGSTATTYSVIGDGDGGTLIDPPASDPAVARFAQTAAAFAPREAAKTALVSSTASVAQTPFAHATASAGHP